MSTNALPTQGLVVKRGDGASPEVFTTISDLTNLGRPGYSATVIDVTDLSSTSRQKRPGIKDLGQLTMTINYLPADTIHAAIKSAVGGAATNWQILFTDSPVTTVAIVAFVSSWSESSGQDDKVEAQVTLEVNTEA